MSEGPQEDHKVGTKIDQIAKKEDSKSNMPSLEELAVFDSIHDASDGPPMPRDDVGYPEQLRGLLGSDRIADLPAAIHDAFTVLRTNDTGKNDKVEHISQFYALLGELVAKTE